MQLQIGQFVLYGLMSNSYLPDDSLTNISKLLHLHRSKTKFTVKDHQLQIEVKRHISPYTPRNKLVDEHWRTIWLILEQSYFRPIEEIDQHTLRYLQNLWEQSQSDANGDSQLYDRQSFTRDLFSVFNEQYIAEMGMLITGQERSGWLVQMATVWKRQKELPMSLRQQLNQQTIMQIFKEEYSSLNARSRPNANFDQDYPTQLQRVIQTVEQQLRSIHEEISSQVINIYRGILYQRQTEESLLSFLPIENNPSALPFKRISARTQDILTQKQFFIYQIAQLQRKQVADSLFQLIRIEEQQSSFYVVSAEAALGIGELRLNQKQFMFLNGLREVSLCNYYFVGWKSKYNYTSQNFYNFQTLRTKSFDNKQNHQSSEGIVPTQSSTSNKVQQFRNMQMCHQCKCMYQTLYLTKCNYQGKSNLHPHPKLAYDSYLQSIAQAHKLNSLQQRQLFEATQGTNWYYRYRIQNNTCYCDRYYCKMCLKAYPQRKEGLCPFCQGVCHCSRCLRNDIIFKLKTQLLIIGGRITDIQSASHFQSLISDMIDNSKELLMKPTLSKNKKVYKERLVYLQRQLQRMRFLCVLVRRRQELKLKLLKLRRQIANSFSGQASMLRLQNTTK